ncbi:response regulator [Brevundimonas sp. AAP58]|uniref:response regulator n=1 Tax=Brevundimonas sp. AAP58 TaxID=1523422 RepID=UPI0006B9AD17|nr:response regulator [Brevundimonas sp. AAP58]KPF79074.1 response regulator [Brevundimonas sp. AAP58]
MTTGLDGCRVLVVEDESLVAMLLETMLEDMGCTPVGPIGTVDEALEVIAADPGLDAALLDVNVAGRVVFPVASALAERNVPFLFSTGYGEGGLPDDWRGRPTIQKPFTEATVREALQKTLGISLA